MNWLAHCYLSEPSPAFRVGSLLPDILRPHALGHLPVDYQAGIARHHRIDRFTDLHPIVLECRLRFPSPLRRYSGVLIDVFFDHILARDWDRYSPTPLHEFTADIYDAFDQCRDDLPTITATRLSRMRENDLLGSYANLSGITYALRRLAARLSRPFDLAASTGMLENQYEAFRSDFQLFFPELISHVKPGSPG
ncbi:MAG: ACP phosphodiesterase [Verrucomicrobiales bacterium]|nr:DUF479 domain-containing protein [Verrucomicrobiae bacterium]MCP5552936.1 DUF479 domain-containing protein [Akkermansiaceae bacterium]HRX53466.1 ACP phosphodiesterase [Verrucomicrobiales bacterium]